MAAGKTYFPIATTTLGSAQADVTFSTISGSYTDLVIIGLTSTSATAGTSLGLQFNSDTANNYSSVRLLGDGSSASSAIDSSISAPRLALLSSSTTEFTSVLVNINNYSNTTTYKTLLSRGNYAGAYVTAYTGLWRSTSAITSVKLFSLTGDLRSGSTFTLYGIAAA
jgi:hypothetical protein